MRRRIVFIGVVLCLTPALGTACKSVRDSNHRGGAASTTASPSASADPAASSPTAAFRTYYTSLKDKNLSALKSVLRSADLARMEAQAKKKDQSLDDFIRDTILPGMSRELPLAMPETRNEKIEGEHATLEFMDNGEWITGKFTKEGPNWKVDI